MGRADGPSGTGGPGPSDRGLRHSPLLAGDGPYADRHGAAEAGHPQRRSFADLLSGHGGPWVQRGHSVEITRVRVGLRDEVGRPGFRAGWAAATRLGRFLRGAGLDRPRDAAHPAWLVAR